VRLARMAAAFGILLTAISSGAMAQAPADNDHTLDAMRDEMARSKSVLQLKIPGTDQPVKPYYIEYRLLDVDVREVVAQFGALMTTTHTRTRFMDVEARVGDYHNDSSNFIGEEGFRGFIGSTAITTHCVKICGLRQTRPSRRPWKATRASKPI